jgi:hypothetical protein
MGYGQRYLALGGVGRQGDLAQETVGRGKEKLHPALLSGLKGDVLIQLMPCYD